MNIYIYPLLHTYMHLCIRAYGHTCKHAYIHSLLEYIRADVQDMGLSWGEALVIAKGRTQWSYVVFLALRPTGDENDNQVSTVL